jgi:hypothetical protein
MPFSQRDSESFYKNIIKAAVEEFEHEGIKIACYKSNENSKTGNVIDQIIEGLAESEIVIADLNNKNPNVFYELGIRHALRNNTILLANKVEDLIFDVANERVIFCDSRSDDTIIKEKIKAALKSIITSEKISDSPVRKYLQNKALEKIIYENVVPGLNAVENLLIEFNSLKATFIEQNNLFKNIVQSLSLEQRNNLKADELKNEITILEKLVGGWYSPLTQSHYYMYIVNNKLEVCYCYCGNDRLTAKYEDILIYDNVIISKFVWLNNSISGVVFFEYKDDNNFTGGWWYDEDLDEMGLSHNLILGDLPKNSMVKLDITRIKDLTFENYPYWAKEYFNKLKK